MRILITGATGKIGSRLTRALLQERHSIRILVRDSKHEIVKELAAKGVEAIEGDIMKQDTLASAVSDMDAVIHMAAFFRSQDADRIRSVNLDGTRNLADAALRANPNIRFLFTSTTLVYDNKSAPAKEDDPVQPNMIYPRSKVEAEEYLLNLHKSRGLDAVIVRLAFVYGAGDPHLQEAVPLFARWKMHPANRMHLVHHSDIVQSVKLLLGARGVGGEIFNVGDDSPVTVYEILHLLNEHIDLIDSASPLENPWAGIVSTEKIRKLGFRPMVPSLYAAKELSFL